MNMSKKMTPLKTIFHLSALLFVVFMLVPVSGAELQYDDAIKNQIPELQFNDTQETVRGMDCQTTDNIPSV